MAAVPLRAAQNSEVLPDICEDPGSRTRDRLHAVVVGSDAVDEVESVGGLIRECLDLAGLLKIFVANPVCSLFLHLAVWVAAALNRLQWLLKGLRNIAVVDHSPTQVNNLVDVLYQ